MKKTILAVAFMAVAMVSCQDKKAEVGQEVDSLKTEIEATTEETVDAIDSTATEAKKDVKDAAAAGAEKVEEVAKDAKEELKK